MFNTFYAAILLKNEDNEEGSPYTQSHLIFG